MRMEIVGAGPSCAADRDGGAECPYKAGGRITEPLRSGDSDGSRRPSGRWKDRLRRRTTLVTSLRRILQLGEGLYAPPAGNRSGHSPGAHRRPGKFANSNEVRSAPDDDARTGGHDRFAGQPIWGRWQLSDSVSLGSADSSASANRHGRVPSRDLWGLAPALARARRPTRRSPQRTTDRCSGWQSLAPTVKAIRRRRAATLLPRPKVGDVAASADSGSSGERARARRTRSAWKSSRL